MKIDFKKKAEEILAELYFIVGPKDHHDDNVLIIEKALKEAYNEAIEESAKTVGDTVMRFSSEQEIVMDHILGLKVTP